ncbi:MAG: RtcB family protein [Acidobacteria bacterium]|jgi:tRNA-splicing ligase RtcB|nr:RtcB family protein [Acidobacteriota bacterium]
MDLSLLKRRSEHEWVIEPHGAMRVPGVLFANEDLVRAMDHKVHEQVSNVATLPGIVAASLAMPDAHWGYGFAVGGVAAFDPDEGVVSAGGVGFDISCGVRCLRTRLRREHVEEKKKTLADALFRTIPAGVGSRGRIRLKAAEMDRMLGGGAQWAVESGWGERSDLERVEEGGRMRDARPEHVSERAKTRMRDEVGTLGSGNHYLEVQTVAEVHDAPAARAFGLEEGDVVVSIHCGSRGLGHQIGTEALKDMLTAGRRHAIRLPDRELACAPIHSREGRHYLGAMRAAINVALANRQVLTHLTREVFAEVLPEADLTLLYDVSHNTCKVETHEVDGRARELFVHRKGATRAWGPGHSELPGALRGVGQPVLIGGTMGTCSYVLVGTERGMKVSFGSACHGAGRGMSRHQARKRWQGREVVQELERRGILVRSPSLRGVAEEAPDAYKDVSAVVDATERAGLARRVARLVPMVTIKG